MCLPNREAVTLYGGGVRACWRRARVAGLISSYISELKTLPSQSLHSSQRHTRPVPSAHPPAGRIRCRIGRSNIRYYHQRHYPCLCPPSFNHWTTESTGLTTHYYIRLPTEFLESAPTAGRYCRAMKPS